MEESYNVSGDTVEKAVRFFVSALNYAGIAVSPLLKKAGSNGAGGSKKETCAPTKVPRA